MIYCSPITKRLLVHKNRIPTERVQPLEMDTRHVIEGVGVWLIDANHCPGAAMILFEVPAPSSCKASPEKVTHPSLPRTIAISDGTAAMLCSFAPVAPTGAGRA